MRRNLDECSMLRLPPHGYLSNAMPDQGETDRYRQAAEDALQQLDWCIGYLHGIHKSKISQQLARNRSFIRRNLMHMSEEPVPSQVAADE
jgi:hypothetical protein